MNDLNRLNTLKAPPLCILKAPFMPFMSFMPFIATIASVHLSGAFNSVLLKVENMHNVLT